MDEASVMDPAVYALFKQAAMEHGMKARDLADSLQEFITFYPDRELQRKGAYIVSRLRSIAAASD